MDYLIGLDIGTTAIKGVLMSVDGVVVEKMSGGYDYYGEENVKLLDPKRFTEICFSVIGRLAQSVKEGERVLAICSCCASGNLILLDEKNRPVTPIIAWQTAISQEDLAEFYSEKEKQEIYQMSGWPLGVNMPIAYLPAIRKYRSELLDKAKSIVMSAEYLNYALTGKWGIAHSMGTPSYLMDQENGVYNKKLLEKFGIADKFMPPIFDKGTVLGSVLPECADKLNLSPDTKVVLGSFDHPSGALGAGVFEEGEMLLSCGTSWVEFFPVTSRDFAISTNSLVDRFMLEGSTYCVMKSIPSISDKIDTLRHYYLGEISHKEYDELAKEAPLGSNGLRFSFTDEDYHIGKQYSKNDIARAIIEGAAVILKKNLDELEKCGLKAEKITMIGGISNSKVCVNIVSEVLERPVAVANGQVAGAVGSALLAGIGAGVYQDEKTAYSQITGSAF